MRYFPSASQAVSQAIAPKNLYLKGRGCGVGALVAARCREMLAHPRKKLPM